MLLGFAEDVLEIQQDAHAAVAPHQRGSHALVPGAPRSPDAVHVVLDLLRHVEVDDVLDPREIEAFRRHVRGDEDVLAARLKFVHRPIPLLLVLAPVDGHHLHALAQQVLVDGVHVALVLQREASV